MASGAPEGKTTEANPRSEIRNR